MNLEEIFTFENLYAAYVNCRKSKQHKGEVIRFEANLSLYLVRLQNDIMQRKYKFGNYRVFKIYEPKERVIEALPFKDRIVIRCFCDQVLRSKIEKKLIYDNGACRRGKGTDFALGRLEKFLRHAYFEKGDNHIYYLKCDIRQFFPSIDHDILLSLLKKENFSADEMWMIEKMIKEQPNQNKVGLPLGNQSSQWFALFYLNGIDRYIKETVRVKGYVRYMDDMILIHRDKAYLRKCLAGIEERCHKDLHLELNQKTQIGRVCDGISFLGYRHILNKSGSITRVLCSTSKRRMKKHLRTMDTLQKKGLIDNTYVNIRKSAFYNHIKSTINHYIFKEILKTDDIGKN